MRALAVALLGGATGCGLFLGVDWDRVEVRRNIVGLQPDGAPIYAPWYDGGDPNPQGACTAPEIECLDGCCAPGSDPGKPAHVAAGEMNSCAVTTSGQVRCWGSNGSGQLGLGNDSVTLLTSNKPLTAHRIPRGATAVAVGASHVCAVVNGALACWGSNSAGELGIASTASSNLPQRVVGSDVPHAVAAGQTASCAVFGSGASCWGINTAFQLGEEADSNVTTPHAIGGRLADGVAQIAVSYQHACAIQAGAVYCWGTNNANCLGSTATRTGTPVATGVTGGATALALGYMHTCAIVGGGAKCWGDNVYGELGNDAVPITSMAPVTPTGLDGGVSSICAGFEFTCAVVNGGAVCFGANVKGQLGVGDLAVQYKRVPTPVVGLGSGVKEVACGYMHACALKDDGSVLCWGHNDQGQLGNGASDDTSKPVNVIWP
jgi:alpha-tubulin suppressor-like RCC1 family protein